MALTETSTEQVAPPVAPEAPVAPPTAGSGAGGNDHKTVAAVFLGIAFVFLVVGGVLAVVMRAQLSTTDSTLLTDQQYRTLFTFHGTFLVFLFLLPAWIGVATAVVPLQIGAARLAFPRLQTMALWLTMVGGALMTSAAFVQGSKRLISGWTLGLPIPEGNAAFRGRAVDLLVLGAAVVLGAGVLAAANFIVTIIKLRAPGLTNRRVPMFSWSVLVSSAVLLLSLPVLIAGFGMMYVEHHFGAHLFSGLTSSGQGDALWWPRLFWFGAYPMLWALVLPAFGLVAEVIPVFVGRPIADRDKALAAFGFVGVLAFFGWGSEVRNLPLTKAFFAIGALVVFAPAASILLNCLLTFAKAAKERGADAVSARLSETPMVQVLGVVAVLAVGLATGVVSALTAGQHLHSTYWEVGEQHLLYFAPATLAVVAALHFWGPKVWGRHLSAAAGKLEAVLLAGGALLGFVPALVLGLQNMPTNTSSYAASDGWRAGNLLMSVGTGVLTLGLLVVAFNVLFCIVLRRGRPAAADPWGGHTLEWTAPTPLPRHNFDRLPEVRSATPALDLRMSQGA